MLFSFNENEIENPAIVNAFREIGFLLQQRIQTFDLLVEATWDPASIADGDEVAVDITVTGAALGDFVLASFSLDITDLVLNAQVTAANIVTAVLANNTGGAIDLASGTIKVGVVRSNVET